MKKIILSIVLLALVPFCRWNGSEGDLNAQIIYADYSDPDVCEGANGDYWLTASSFQCTPGLPILHSTDLQNWHLVNYAIDTIPMPEGVAPLKDGESHGKHVWAPSIRLHNNTYYIYWGDPDYGIWMVKTTNPEGRWDEPVLVVAGRGLIDPTPLWDEDGRCYLVNAWAASRCGFNSVLTIRELSADGTQAIGTPRMVYDGQTEGNHTVEGPKLYKRDGYYYILAPAGGVEQGWQLALRSKNIYGPYESTIVFNKDGIHQGGLVSIDSKSQSKSSQDKAAFIAFQDRGPYGRILHLLDVEWQNAWPMMKQSKRDKKGDNTTSDVCSKVHPSAAYSRLLSYQWHSSYKETFGFLSERGVRIYSHNVSRDFRNLWEVPNLFLKKFEGETFTDTLHLTISAKSDGQESGFVIMGRDYIRLSACLQDGKFLLNFAECHAADTGASEHSSNISTIEAKRYNAGAKDNYECQLHVRIHCEKGALSTIAYSTDGTVFHTLPTTFQARVGKWIGAKYGAFSIAPHDTDKGWSDLQLR